MTTDAERAVERAVALRDAEITDAGRRLRGVVHTPPRIARFVAREVDRALVALGRAGLADPDVVIVDPACGPGVFLAAALAEAGAGAPRLALGLELDPRAVESAERALRGTADERGWPLRIERADTLAGPPPLRARERHAATLAILGNPPWAGRSANRGATFTDARLDDFRRELDGAPLSERKIGVLSDDYVRFWRWAAEAARAAEGGAVVALVTNASFLDGPVHRGMRAALARWFTRIEITDLGGSALIARRGDPDENVFSVRPGVAITVATRAPDCDEGELASLHHVAIRGSREEKLIALEGPLERAELAPSPPLLRWVPTPDDDPEWLSWPSLPELMPFHREGLQTNKDELCVDADRERLLERLTRFAAGDPGPGRADVPSAHYDPAAARASVRAALGEADPVRRFAYRPLDDRWVAAIPKLCHRPRPDLLAAMARSEVALLTVRKDRGEREWAHFGVTRHAVDNCFSSARSSCRTRAFPTHQPDGEENVGEAARGWPGGAPSPRQLVRYVLCVLAAGDYRRRFDAELRADYPRIPPPPSVRALEACTRAGAALEAVFLGDDGPSAPPQLELTPLEIGHHRLDPRAPRVARLRAAIDECNRVMRAVLSSPRPPVID